MKKLLALALCVLMVLPIVACTPAAPAEKKEAATTAAAEAAGADQTDEAKSDEKTDAAPAAVKDAIVVAASGDAISLDPISTNDNQSSNVMLQIYEGLVKLNPETRELENCLAESMDHPDDSTYIFHLRKDVKFHNGETLKASDVVFSLKRAIASATVGYLYNTIDPESVKATDDLTVEFKMAQPYAGIVSALAHPGAFICNEKAVTDGGEQYKMNPVGTGPFKFISWSKADRVELERFEDYHGTKPAYSKLTFRVIPEANNRSIELESGGVDLAYDVAPIDVDRLSNGDKTQMFRDLDYDTTYLGFNCQKKPFDDPRVREAVALALDLQSIADKAFLGVAKVAPCAVPGTLQYSAAADSQARARDLEKAKALLKEAGLENGFDTTLATNENQQRIDMATMMKGQLAEIGVNITIQSLEWSAFNDLIKNGDQDMFIIAWIADSPDIDTFIFPCFHSSTVGEGGNYAYYVNEELDKLLLDARVESDATKRGELYKQAQDIIYKDVPWVPLCNKELLVGASKDLQGLTLSPFGWYELAPVTVPAK